MQNRFLNITLQFLQDSQRVSLSLFLICGSIIVPSMRLPEYNGINNTRVPNCPTIITHFLETTTLFPKQSNRSLSKINPVIKVYGIFKFQRTCVCNSFPFKLLQKLPLAFQPWNNMRMLNWIILPRQWMRSRQGDKDYSSAQTEFLLRCPGWPPKQQRAVANGDHMDGTLRRKQKAWPSHPPTAFFGGIQLPTLPTPSSAHDSRGSWQKQNQGKLSKVLCYIETQTRRSLYLCLHGASNPAGAQGKLSVIISHS